MVVIVQHVFPAGKHQVQSKWSAEKSGSSGFCNLRIAVSSAQNLLEADASLCIWAMAPSAIVLEPPLEVPSCLGLSACG
uniref:Uncharacterized protein n=1 Tax=Arundo donax TaxID=35708 RepID=A0A0A9EW27_ARUDO